MGRAHGVRPSKCRCAPLLGVVSAGSRLTSEEWLSDSDVGIYSFTYEFDAAGNRSLLTKDGVTTYYSYNTLNQLTLTESTEGALTYTTYQADGALETKHDADGWAYYEWDVDEALLRVIPQGGSTVTGQANELYDAQMKRVARDLDGTATYYVFDGEKIARVEQPEAGTRDFYVQEGQSIYSPLVSVHDEAADAQYWYLFDALGSTMGLVDANGNLSGKLQYDAFGNVLAEEDVPRSAFFKYVGAYQYMPEDSEDMMLLWHRWYDPTVGRFVGRDVERRGGSLVYDYARGGPTSFVDPDGLFLFWGKPKPPPPPLKPPTKPFVLPKPGDWNQFPRYERYWEFMQETGRCPEFNMWNNQGFYWGMKYPVQYKPKPNALYLKYCETQYGLCEQHCVGPGQVPVWADVRFIQGCLEACFQRYGICAVATHGVLF